MFTCVPDAMSCFHSLISTRTFRRALISSLLADSCMEIKSAPLVLAEFGERWAESEHWSVPVL